MQTHLGNLIGMGEKYIYNVFISNISMPPLKSPALGNMYEPNFKEKLGFLFMQFIYIEKTMAYIH